MAIYGHIWTYIWSYIWSYIWPYMATDGSLTDALERIVKRWRDTAAQDNFRRIDAAVQLSWIEVGFRSRIGQILIKIGPRCIRAPAESRLKPPHSSQMMS